jgi:hypothetical protein
MELLARPSLARREAAVAVLVVSGLVISTAAGVFLIDAPKGGLPGIALGSRAILMVEQIAILFAGWLLAVVVVARALAGELPIEISGRGVRYADAATAQSGWDDSERAFERVDEEIATLQDAIAALATKQDDPRIDNDDML